jgi:hypothetical protein
MISFVWKGGGGWRGLTVIQRRAFIIFFWLIGQ